MSERPLADRVRHRLASIGADANPASLALAVRSEGAVFGDQDVLAVSRVLESELAGVGVLEPLLADSLVSDVLVNGPQDVWVDRGCGLERVAVRFPDDADVRRLATRLAAAAGRRLDEATPYADVRVGDRIRLHAVIPPITRSTCLSLRVLRRRAFTLDELEAVGTVTPAAAQVLRDIVAARRAFVVSGGTGSGKTTLLSTLLGLVDAAERIVLVEDASELAPAHPHVVALQARVANLEGAGVVTLRDLVRQALRMRPDRIVVGEVRGAEVVDLLAALNTGHDGGAGTLHANSAADVPARLEALALAGGLNREALHSQLAAGLDLVVHLARSREGVRRVAEVCVLERGTDGLVAARPALRVDAVGRLIRGPAAARLRRLLSASSVS